MRILPLFILITLFASESIARGGHSSGHKGLGTVYIFGFLIIVGIGEVVARKIKKTIKNGKLNNDCIANGKAKTGNTLVK